MPTDMVNLCVNVFDGICIVGMVVLCFIECFRHSMQKKIKEIEQTVSSIKTDVELLQYKMDEMIEEFKKIDIIEIEDVEDINETGD